MRIDSTRFGPIEIAEDAVLEFPDGLIGLPGTRWALIAQNETSTFFWLHSVDDPSLALPVTMPWLFFNNYEVEVSDEDAAELKLEGPENADIFCVVRASDRLEDFTVNLCGPIVVHGARRLGRQIINETSGYEVRQPLFSEVDLASVPPARHASPMAATGI
ncbi:MAG: flagellar assembly protein FliW [Gaiellales bacterium]